MTYDTVDLPFTVRVLSVKISYFQKENEFDKGTLVNERKGCDATCVPSDDVINGSGEQIYCCNDVDLCNTAPPRDSLWPAVIIAQAIFIVSSMAANMY